MAIIPRMNFQALMSEMISKVPTPPPVGSPRDPFLSPQICVRRTNQRGTRNPQTKNAESTKHRFPNICVPFLNYVDPILTGDSARMARGTTRSSRLPAFVLVTGPIGSPCYFGDRCILLETVSKRPVKEPSRNFSGYSLMRE